MFTQLLQTDTNTAPTADQEGTPLQMVQMGCGCSLCAGVSPIMNIGGDGISFGQYPGYTKQSPEFVIKPGEGGWYHTNGLPYWIEALMPGYSMVVNHDLKYHFATTFPTYPVNAPMSTSTNVAYPWVKTELWDGERLKAIQIQNMRDTEQLIDVRFTETDNPDQPATINYIISDFVQANSGAMPPWESGGTFSYNYDRFLGIQFLQNPSRPFEKQGNSVSANYVAFTQTSNHELGHNLGLSHPFDLSQIRMPGIENNAEFTLMAYSQYDLNDLATWHQRYGTGFRDLDLAALQYLYGPSKAVRTGNDTYRLSKDKPNFVWDGVGVDTLDASDQTAPVTLSLTPGYWGYIGAARGERITAAGQVTVNFNSTIENLMGTAYDDRLTGNDSGNGISAGAGNDTITGGKGDDHLVGGDGIDTAVYANSKAAHVITRTATGWSIKDTTPDENIIGGNPLGVIGTRVLSHGTDVLDGIERVRFSDTSLALDMGEGQSANQAARLVGVLGKQYLSDKVLMGAAIGVMDAGLGIGGAAKLLLDKGVMATLAGGSDDASLIKLLVNNVLGRPASADDLSIVEPLVAQHGQQWLITVAAQLPANASQIDLVGLSSAGLAFV